jgi:GDP-L-fucose synthase
MRHFHEARLAGAAEVVCWDTGTARREFLHVDDLADACVFLPRRFSAQGRINVGTGTDILIRKLTEMLREVTGYGRADRLAPHAPGRDDARAEARG